MDRMLPDDCRHYAYLLRKLGCDAAFHKVSCMGRYLPTVLIHHDTGKSEMVYEHARMMDVLNEQKDIYFQQQVAILECRVYN